METALSNLRINAQRLQVDFETRSNISKTDRGGVNRPAFSQDCLAARDWFRDRVLEADLELCADAGGNISAFLDCYSDTEKTLLMGSHIDSVLDGGRYDGALGVVSALEVLRVIKENKISLPFNLEAIDFTDHEGSFVECMGSSALVGNLTPSRLHNTRKDRDELLANLDPPNLQEERILDAKRDLPSLAGYLELHIEQGNQLGENNAQFGIVSEIQGLCSYYFTNETREDTPGTVQKQDCPEPLAGVSALKLAVRQTITEDFTDCVASVSDVNTQSGGKNKSSSRARVSIEFRAPDIQRLNQLEETLKNQGACIVENYLLECRVELINKFTPVSISRKIQDIFSNAAQVINVNYEPIVSRSNHDGMLFADIHPAGIILIPSQSGISHSPNEFS